MPEYSVDVVVFCAMEEEAKPFIDALESPSPIRVLPCRYKGSATFHDGHLFGLPAVVVTSGIGLTNAATAATAILSHLAPKLVIVAGTTGGLAKEVGLDEVMLADCAIYHDADATGFGYEPGQIPRMPAKYPTHVKATDTAYRAAVAAGLKVRRGDVSSSNSFVTANQVASVRAAFPNTIAVDMETAAIAQVCWSFGCPWVSLRAVSDLCDGGEFTERAPHAYQTSFAAASALLQSDLVLPSTPINPEEK